jgi:DNA polymerase-1
MRVYESEKQARDMLTKPDSYRDMRFIAGEGPVNPDVILVKAMPSWADNKSGKPFMGDEGLPLRKALLQEGISFYATHAFPFFKQGYKLKVDDGRDFYFGYMKELRAIECRKVALFGAEAVKLSPFIDAPDKKLSSLMGRTLDVGEFQVRVFPHASQIVKVPTMFSTFLDSLKDFIAPKPSTIGKPKYEAYIVHTNRKNAEAVLRQMPKRRVACDIETDGLDPYTSRILTIQFAWVEGVGHSIPWNLFTPEEWDSHLFGHDFIFQNGSFDVKVLRHNGINIRIHEDTMLMHSLVDETPGTHSMEQLAVRYLGIEKWSDQVNYDNMAENDIKTLGEYGARDADITLRLATQLRPLVEDRKIHQILTDSQNAIISAELRGVRINRDLARQFDDELAGHMHDASEYMADTYGLANPNSPKQVAELLYGKMKLPIQKFQGRLTTNEAALETLAKDHDVPIVRDILQYRHMTKAKGTYLANILEQSKRDGRYHPDFKLAATETGRLTEKLIMLIPRPSTGDNPDIGQRYLARLRELFIPDEGHVMIGADYSGLEVSMAAHLTNDAQLIKDVNDKLDTHSAVAIQAFKLDEPLEPYETLKKRVSAKYDYYRSLAKQATFTWLYGGSRTAIARQLGIDDSLADSILEALRSRYVGVAAWHDMVHSAVLKEANISTPWGRTRRFFFHPSMDRKVTEEQLRESINSPIQGMSSDMTIAAFAQLTQEGYQTLFPLHDAVYLQVTGEEVDKAMKVVRQTMEGILRGPVPFRCDVKSGPDWSKLG